VEKQLIFRIVTGAALAVLLAGFTSTPLLAQWLRYPTPGVPRTADGKPNLAAPTPRTADGNPDFSGLWITGNPLPCTGDGLCSVELPVSREVFNFGTSLRGGLPYKPEVAALVKQRTSENSKDDPHARCLPDTFLRAYGLPHYQKWIQVPGLLVMLDEMNAMYRQVFTDGRPFPEDPQPAWNGYSSAKWEGDTLVVDSIGFRDDLWLDMAGSPLSDAAKVRERIHRPVYGHVDIEVTVDDPKNYTRPWTLVLRQAIVVDTELVDEICLENEKSWRRMQSVPQ